SQATVIPSEQHQQELDSRLANAETPPAVSNVEIASSFIATMTGEQPPDSPVQQSSLYQPSQSAFTQQIENAELSSTEELEVSGVGTSEESVPGVSVEEVGETSGNSSREVVSGASRTLYSTKDTSDPLNAEIDDDIYIDTKDLCKRIAWELKQHSIPQAIFAERILCRSQGTLSDLLRNPKPWNKLKSGRETFRRMFNWVQLPLSQRLGILEIYKDDGFGGQGKLNLPSSSNIPMILSPPTPAQNARQGSKHKNGHDSEGTGNNFLDFLTEIKLSTDLKNNAFVCSNSAKRPRLVFTDIQKRTLQAIFKETQRPSREMQQTIAEHLRLDLSTVANFFMNARRRSRSGPLQGDVPAPYQQVRPITPPPASPPQRPLGRSRNARHASRIEVESTTSVATSSHIENTVAQVAEEAAEYARNVEQVIRLEPSAVVNSQQDLEDDRIEGRDTLPLDSDSNNVLRGDEKTLKTEEPDHNKSQTYEGQGNSTTSPSVFENKDPVKTKQENLSDSET
uniref:One cut domain family member n=1 Tax=Syphacia muris TaxID=451379 RepID=A0A0N5AYF2_9BILA